jgi:hypothetical protein
MPRRWPARRSGDVQSVPHLRRIGSDLVRVPGRAGVAGWGRRPRAWNRKWARLGVRAGRRELVGPSLPVQLPLIQSNGQLSFGNPGSAGSPKGGSPIVGHAHASDGRPGRFGSLGTFGSAGSPNDGSTMIGHGQARDGRPGKLGSLGTFGSAGSPKGGSPIVGHAQSSGGKAQLLTVAAPPPLAKGTAGAGACRGRLPEPWQSSVSAREGRSPRPCCRRRLRCQRA